MDINIIKKLPICKNELTVNISENNLIMLYKTTSEEVACFKNNPNIDFFVNQTEDFDLILSFQTANAKMQTLSFKLNNENKESSEIYDIYNNLLNKHTISLFIFSNDINIEIPVTIYQNDVQTIYNWIHDIKNTPDTSFSFCENYKDSPVGYLIPQRSNTLFWFISKLTDDNYNIAKENINNLSFKADIFEGELVLYLAYDSSLLSVIEIPDSIIDDNLREDFKLLFTSNKVSILLNKNNAADSSILRCDIDIDKSTFDRIKHYIQT